MWRVSDKYTQKPFSQLKRAEFQGICGKRSAAEYTKSENHVGKLTGDAAQYMWRVSDKYTKKPFSQLKQTEFYGICGKRSASEYTQSEIMLANWQALLRSICGA